jgi:hypothetical protein
MDVAYKLGQATRVNKRTVTGFLRGGITMPDVFIQFGGFIKSEKNSGLRSSGHRLSLIFLLPLRSQP